MSYLLNKLHRTLFGHTSSDSGLDDDVLIDIFHRLPNETVFACKCVSKRWFSLISDPRFAVPYLNKLISATSKEPPQHTFMLQTSGRNIDIDNGDHIVPNMNLTTQFINYATHPSRRKGLYLEFLPHRTQVAATFKDLVLCYSVVRSKQIRFYLCNPLTRRWVSLPSSPLLPYHDHKFWAALICEEPYHYNLEDDDNNSGIFITRLKVDYRFRVVVVHPFPEIYDGINFGDQLAGFKLLVFCSESYCWRKINLIVPTPDDYFPSTAAPFQGGVVYDNRNRNRSRRTLCLWHNLKFGEFDPFEVTATCDSNLRATTLPLPLTRSQLVESEGILFAINTDDLERVRMQKLEMKPENNGWEWITLQVYLQNSSIVSGNRDCQVIGVCPTNPKLVCLMVKGEGENQVVLCDFELGRLIPLGIQVAGQLAAVYRLVFQEWPTPIPKFNVIPAQHRTIQLSVGS